MNYEKAYKEALERAKNLRKDAIDMGETIRAKLCEIIFPELKESEDEKIRKYLLKLADRCPEDSIDFMRGVKKGDIIAWLEKQGEQNPYSGVSFKYDGHTWGMCARDNGVEVMIDSKLVAFINQDLDVKSMVESYQKRLANQCNASVESPLVKICITSYRHGIENTIDELELNGLNKRQE